MLYFNHNTFDFGLRNGSRQGTTVITLMTVCFKIPSKVCHIENQKKAGRVLASRLNAPDVALMTWLTQVILSQRNLADRINE